MATLAKTARRKAGEAGGQDGPDPARKPLRSVAVRADVNRSAAKGDK
jgi:hypothetical protein